MKRTAVVLALLVGACSQDVTSDALKCRVSEADLSRAMKAAASMQPYSGKAVGSCELIVDDARNVMVITPDIQRSVENMIAREKAEGK